MEITPKQDAVRRNVPKSIVDAVDAAVRAGQQYSSAVAHRRGLEKCKQKMQEQKDAVQNALDLISAELTRRYEGGIEMGLAQASATVTK